MTALHKLSGSALLAYGRDLSEQAVIRKAAQSGRPDEGICSNCKEPLPKRSWALAELNLERHPRAINGFVTCTVPCENPACVEARDLVWTAAGQSLRKTRYEVSITKAGVRNMPCTFHNFDTDWVSGIHSQALQGAHDKIRAWAEDPRHFVLISGPYGCGKTHLAVAALKEHLWARSADDEHSSGFHLACVEAWEAIKSSWNGNQGTIQYRDLSLTPANLLMLVKRNRLLIIDDFDKVTPSEGWLGWILAIINYRVDTHLPTIITLNHRIDEMLSFLTTRQNGSVVTWKDKSMAMWDRVVGDSIIKLQLPTSQPSFRRKK